MACDRCRGDKMYQCLVGRIMEEIRHDVQVGRNAYSSIGVPITLGLLQLTAPFPKIGYCLLWNLESTVGVSGTTTPSVFLPLATYMVRLGLLATCVLIANHILSRLFLTMATTSGGKNVACLLRYIMLAEEFLVFGTLSR